MHEHFLLTEKRFVDLVFSPPKHTICKRKLQFSESLNDPVLPTPHKAVKKRKLIKVHIANYL